MSEMERRKATLKMVTTCSGNPYDGNEWTVQDYISMEYGVYIQEPLSNKECISFLEEYYWEEFDKPSPYFLVNDVLFKKVEETYLDCEYNASAHWVSRDTVEVDCTWYNGGGSFEEVVEQAINSLEER